MSILKHEIFKIPVGGIYIEQMVDAKIGIDGWWPKARPFPYRSFISRLRLAWDVLRYKADALYWYKQ